MAYTIKQARPVLLEYLGLTEQTANYIADTDNWGILFEKDGKKYVIFVMPLGENTSSPKIYFDIRDSGAEKFVAAWNYAKQNNHKFFCLGVKDEVPKYKNYIISVEADIHTVLKISGLENGRRSGAGTQLNIPSTLIPDGKIARAKSTKFDIFFSVIEKDFIFTYLEIFDNRLFQYIKNDTNNKDDKEKEEISLSTTAKECARQIIQKIYEYDEFENINSILRMNTNIKIDTDEICPEDVLYNVFYTAGSEQFNNEKRTFLDKEYEVTIDEMNITCRLTNQWCGFGEIGDEIQNGRNYLWALRDIVNIHYEGIFKIENDGAIAKLICYTQTEYNKYSLKFNKQLNSNKSRNRIVFGAPGTGKSFNLNKDAKELVGSKNKDGLEIIDPSYYERITFHPNFSYAQFAGTYKPVSTGCENTDGISYEYIPGAFIRLLVKALKNARDESEAKPFLLIIEEINRANVSAVFGDIFQLLDRNNEGFSEYEIETSEDLRKYLSNKNVLGGKPADYQKIRIPNNLFIWATMNSADQGVFPMDTAFKRRWDFEYIGIDENAEKLVYEDGRPILIPIPSKNGKISKGGITYDLIEWNKFRTEINRKLSENTSVNEDKLLGPFFISLDKLRSAKDNPLDFIKCIKSKILMYLFEDVVKISPAKFFKNCGEHPKYSDICSKFDEVGAAIFGIPQESIIPAETANDEYV